jgi:AraC-like DNA-binding protein
MIPDLSNAFILFGGGLSFLLAIVQLFQQQRSRFKNLLLFIIFTSLGVIQIQEYAVSSIPMEIESAGMIVLLLAKFILGPSLYLFYLAVFNKDYTFHLKELIHFVPSMLVTIVVLILVTPLGNIGFLSRIHSFIVGRSVVENLHALGFALIFGYIMAVSFKLDIMKVIKERNHSRFMHITLTVTLILFFIALMVILSMATGQARFARMAMIITSFFIIYWFVMAQIHPEIFLSDILKNKNVTRIEGVLNGINITNLETDLNELLISEKLFCDEDLSLKRLADLLNIQTQELSVYLNHHLQVNFNNFLNRYRVDEAISLMKEDKERSLLSIAFAVGFNSKSVFYEAFTKQTGMSPARYRKSIISLQKSPE